MRRRSLAPAAVALFVVALAACHPLKDPPPAAPTPPPLPAAPGGIAVNPAVLQQSGHPDQALGAPDPDVITVDPSWCTLPPPPDPTTTTTSHEHRARHEHHDAAGPATHRVLLRVQHADDPLRAHRRAGVPVHRPRALAGRGSRRRARTPLGDRVRRRRAGRRVPALGAVGPADRRAPVRDVVRREAECVGPDVPLDRDGATIRTVPSCPTPARSASPTSAA